MLEASQFYFYYFILLSRNWGGEVLGGSLCNGKQARSCRTHLFRTHVQWIWFSDARVSKFEIFIFGMNIQTARCLHSRRSNFKYLHLFILNSELFVGAARRRFRESCDWQAAMFVCVMSSRKSNWLLFICVVKFLI